MTIVWNVFASATANTLTGAVEVQCLHVEPRRRLVGEGGEVVAGSGQPVDQHEVAARRLAHGEPQRVGDREPAHDRVGVDRDDVGCLVPQVGEHDLPCLDQRHTGTLAVDGQRARCRRHAALVLSVGSDGGDGTVGAVDEHDLVPSAGLGCRLRRAVAGRTPYQHAGGDDHGHADRAGQHSPRGVVGPLTRSAYATGRRCSAHLHRGGL